MGLAPWTERYAGKTVDVREALSHIRNGQTVFVGSGAGEPQQLTDTLAEMASEFRDIEVIHLAAAQQGSKLAQAELVENIRYNTFYNGLGISDAVASGTADFTPMNIAEVPSALAEGILFVDIALVQVAPPDEAGRCSLGVAVALSKSMVAHAPLVIAQVNRSMPVTRGGSFVHVDQIDFLVEGDRPLIEVPRVELNPVSLTIGRHVASLIDDGMVLHFDPGSISAATMRYLDTKRHLGIHTDVLTNDIWRLIGSGAVTNRTKKVYRGKTVATMVLGSEALYRFVDEHPKIEIHPIEKVNHPFVIARHDRMVAVLTARSIELSGLARLGGDDQIAFGSLPSSMDFAQGASRSKGGFTIVALPSTTKDGARSSIVSLSIGRGEAVARARVDYVVTEYGIVNLYGLSIRERAIALISIAHPHHRQQLLDEAKQFNYVHKDHPAQPEASVSQPLHYDVSKTFADGTKVLFRHIQPSDARRLQRLYYSLSPETVRMRYHGSIRTFSDHMVQELATIDTTQDVAIVGLIGPARNQRVIAEARCLYYAHSNMAEFDILVAEECRGLGIGSFLANYLNKIAYARGCSGLFAAVISSNAATMALLNRAWPTAVRSYESGVCTFTVRFPEKDVKHPKDSVFMYSGRFSDFSYGPEHPFRPDRARAALQMIQKLGYLDEPWIRVELPQLVAKEQLFESNEPNYIEALSRANEGVWEDEFLQYNLGGDECPIFRGMFDYVLLYTSSTITGVNILTEENANVVFNPLGGFHHASRTHAEGFCYVNDALVAIDMLLARGFRVAYIDIDAHHGNGVQDAYYRDDRVLVVSLHQSGKTLYPWSGFETEIGEGIGKGFTINVPLPEETDDEAYDDVFERVVTPAVTSFGPTVVVAVIGTDTHRMDPLSGLSLTNNGMVNVARRIRRFSPQLLLLGGGGYLESSTSAGWARMWATANGIDAMPDYLLMVGGSFLGRSGIDSADVNDMSYRLSGDKKRAILEELDRVVDYHEAHTLPILARRVE